MSFYLYILKCSDGSYYTGHTDNLESRFAAHQRGEISGYTSARRPVELVFSQSFPSREEAFHAERQVKGWSRRKKEALFNRTGIFCDDRPGARADPLIWFDKLTMSG